MANPTQLLAATPILDVGAIGATATMPVIPAGNNRIVSLTEVVYNGAGTCNPSTSITSNGKTSQFVVGDPATPQTRLAGQTRWFFEADIASISGQVVSSSGATGSQKSWVVEAFQDCPQVVPSGSSINSGYATANQTFNLSLTRAANSLTVGRGFTSVSTTALAFSNPGPSSTTNLTSRYLSRVTASDSAGTSNFVVTGQAYTTCHVFNIQPLALQTIDSVNGGTDTIALGSAFTWTTSNFSPAPNAATIGGVACTGVSGTGGTAPGLVDGATLPALGTQTLTGSNGSQNASRSQTVTAPTGYISQLLAGTLDTSQYSCLYNMSPAAVAGDRIFAPNANGNVLYADGTFETNLSGTQTWWHWQASTGIVRSFPLITGGGSTFRRSSGKILLGKIISGSLLKGKLL